MESLKFTKKEPEKGAQLVRIKEELTLEDLLALCNREILLLRVPGYLDAKECRVLSGKIMREALPSRYSMAQDLDVFRTGCTLFETQFNSDLKEEYFEGVLKRQKELRDVCDPLQNPNDMVQARLNQIWPAGAGVEELFSRECGFGTCRVFLNGQRLPPHIDFLPKDVKDYPEELYPECQLAANVYICNPREGGELNCWGRSVPIDELAGIQSGVYDFIRDDLLPEPDAFFKPRDGDLILIRASDIHSVSPFQGGNRMAFSFFINYRGRDLPLRYYV